jgi:CO/xanthine dehydrogenase Mo-binding subunit
MPDFLGELNPYDRTPLQHGFSDYLFPTATDMPEISVDFVNKPVDMGELRVKGLAELGISGPVPAIIAAIHDAAGIWITDIPAMPERVLEKLMEAEKNEK